MKLGEKQEKFSRMIVLLMMHIHASGYGIRGGHWYRCSNCYVGSKNSNHKLKLAFDINLAKDGIYLDNEEAEEAHSGFHDFWDSIGGSKRIEGDLNHYSLEHHGHR